MYLRKFSHNILQRFVPAETHRVARGTRLGRTPRTLPVREVTNARVVDLRTDSRDQVSAEMLRYMMEEKVTMKGVSESDYPTVLQFDFRLLRIQRESVVY